MRDRSEVFASEAAGDADAGDADAGDADAGGVDARGVDARGVDARGVDARGVDARGVDARGVDAGDADAGGVDARGVNGASDRPTRSTSDSRSSAAASRRRFLASLGGAGSALAMGVSGCVALGSSGGKRPVSILAAGSLQRTLGEGLRAAVDVPITVEAHGSVTAARLVASGRRDPDILALADVALFERLLDAPWYATVATNALTVAHADRPGGRAIAAADRWFEPVLAGDVSLGRTDPALDPLGYRTVFAADLGEAFYDRPDLREELLAVAGVYPETSLISRLEAGVIDAAVVYRSMAVERGYSRVDLPAAIDLSDPTRAYDGARYELGDGTVVRGRPIRYGARTRRDDERVRHVFETLADGTVLDEHGFGTPAPLPTLNGAVPAAVEV